MPYAPFSGRSGGVAASASSSVSSDSSGLPRRLMSTITTSPERKELRFDQKKETEHGDIYDDELAKIRRALQTQQAVEDTKAKEGFLDQYNVKISETRHSPRQHLTPRSVMISSIPTAIDVSPMDVNIFARIRDNEDLANNELVDHVHPIHRRTENKEPYQSGQPQHPMFDLTSAEGVLIQKAHEEKGEGESVVLYNEGATELFLSIEEVDWDRASRILQEHPVQASVWVVSTGTVGTTFNWSLWKRLPLHEAARRQAPVDFITSLLRAHPTAVCRVTQFGELPLHLAVECGAPPAVVNVLAVHHWMGCHTTDQSGRTPFDILQEAESLLDPLEHQAVHAALGASVKTYDSLLQEHATSLKSAQSHHSAGLLAIRQQHDDDLALEQDQQETLLLQIANLQQHLAQQGNLLEQQQKELQQVQQDGSYWKDRVNKLLQENLHWKQSHQQDKEVVSELRQCVLVRDKEAVVLSDRIVDLQTAMTRLAHWHQETVQTQLASVNQSFQTAMTELSRFTTTLTDHEEDLQTLLFDMSVDDAYSNVEDEGKEIGEETEAHTTAVATKISIENNELDDMPIQRNEEPDEEEDEEAMIRAAQAASNVLLF